MITKQRRDYPSLFFDPPGEKANYRASSVRAGTLSLLSQISSFATRTISTVVLARLLTPADFGLIAMVFALINVAIMFKDAGLNDATLQRDQVSHNQLSTVFWISVTFGIILSVIVAAAAPIIAWFYGESDLIGITLALAIVFLIGGFTGQHQALLRRRMQFGRLALLQVTASVVSVAVAVAAGVVGLGYWSLVLMHVTLACVMAAGCWIALPWIPGRPARGTGVRSMIRFGANVTGFNLANYLGRNADNVLIGRFIGATALGFYSKAYGLLTLPVSQIRTPITSVGLPVLSRLQNDPDRYRSYYLKLLDTLLFAVAPIGLLLAVHSPQVILLLLGEQWMPAADVFRILGILAFPQAAVGTLGMVMLSSGESNRFFRLGVFNAIAAVVSFVAGLPWGIIGVALSYTMMSVIVTFPAAAYGFKTTPITVGLFFRAWAIPALCAAISSLLSRGVFLMLAAVMPMPLSLAVALCVAAMVYLGLYGIIPGGRLILGDLRKSVGSLIRTRPTPAR